MGCRIAFCFIIFLGIAATAAEWTPLPNPAAEGGQAVFLTAHPDGMAMSWIDATSKNEGTFRFAVWTGESWKPSVAIATGSNLFINWADIPKVIFGEKIAVAVWPQMISEGVYDYGLRYSISLDHGRTWQAPDWLHEDLQPREHGFISLEQIDPSTIGAIWLDGRAMGESHDQGHGAMQLRYREVRATGLSPETLLDDMTCECCGTDLVKFQGQMVGIYRNRTADHLRDIEIVVRNSSGTWLSPTALPADQWTIQGCPVNGPALAHTPQHLVATWFTMANLVPKVRLALATQDLSSWKPLATFGNSPIGRVHSAFLDSNHLLTVWLETASPLNEFYYALLDLRKPEAPMVGATKLDATGKGRTSGFPKIFVLSERAYLAYQNPEHPGVKVQWVSVGDLISTD